MAIVDAKLAALAAELDEAFTRILDKHLSSGDSSLRHHTPIGLYLTTVDGVAVSFIEEGLEFYPDSRIVGLTSE